MSKTIDAHDHFVSCMAWGRTTVGAAVGVVNGNGAGVTAGGEKEGRRKVNVLATGSVDQTIKVRVTGG